MHTIYTTTLISENCPNGMTPSKCPLRKYATTNNELFHISVNETHLVPHGGKEALIKMYDEMHAICAKCKTDNNQNSK